MEEEWEILALNNDYIISTFGRIARSYDPDINIIVNPERIRGHIIINMPVRVDFMVANTFISNPKLKSHIKHKDGNKMNNRVENLEWVSKPHILPIVYDPVIRKIDNYMIINIPETDSWTVFHTEKGVSQFKGIFETIGDAEELIKTDSFID
jgi:hypothetical protein